MESCLEGKYFTFNAEMWRLCQQVPQEGGFTTDQWLDMRDLKRVQQFNQEEWGRVITSVHFHFPTCPKCSRRNFHTHITCLKCGYVLRELPAKQKK